MATCPASRRDGASLPFPQPRSATSERGGKSRTKSTTRGHALYRVPCHCRAIASYTSWTCCLRPCAEAMGCGTGTSREGWVGSAPFQLCSCRKHFLIDPLVAAPHAGPRSIHEPVLDLPLHMFMLLCIHTGTRHGGASVGCPGRDAPGARVGGGRGAHGWEQA
eukprot:scaffold834_cov130-Isochrysis_galbana.AAC.4